MPFTFSYAVSYANWKMLIIKAITDENYTFILNSANSSDGNGTQMYLNNCIGISYV